MGFLDGKSGGSDTDQQSAIKKPEFKVLMLAGVVILVIIALLVIVPTKTVMVKNEVSYLDNETYTEQVPYAAREAYTVNESYIDLYNMNPNSNSYFKSMVRSGNSSETCPIQCPCSAYSDIDYRNPPYERYCIECTCEDSLFIQLDEKYKNAIQYRTKTLYHNVTKSNDVKNFRTVTKTRIDQQPVEVNWIFGFNTSYALHLPGVG
jgi:hypothetical protein